MIELPEAVVIARQIAETLGGKRIARAVANASPHKFSWYTGDPEEYNDWLAGKVIGTGCGVGGHIEFEAGDMVLSISAPIRYHTEEEKRLKKHQLLLEFEDGTAISASAQMWGGFPKRKMGDLADPEVDAMYDAVKRVLAEMTAQGGRDTERDLFWQWGGYKTILSKNTVDTPCPACGTVICKEPYLGGAIYFCAGCQKL